MKKCHFCQSEIDDKAIVCPICKRDLVDNPEKFSQQTTTKNTSPIVFIVVGLLTFAAVVVFVWYLAIV